MSVLTDTDILEILRKDRAVRDPTKLVIFPFKEESLTPVGYDLRVGQFYQSNFDRVGMDIGLDEKVVLRKGSTTNIRTLEYLSMPQDKTLSGLICSRVKLVSLGLSHISTTIDPDWHGALSISIHNHTDEDIALNVGERLCTAVFMANKSPATRDSGHAPSRTDTLITTITTSEKSRRERAKRRSNFVIAVGLAATVILFVGGAVYSLQAAYDHVPTFNAVVAGGTVLLGLLAAGIIGVVVARLLDRR